MNEKDRTNEEWDDTVLIAQGKASEGWLEKELATRLEVLTTEARSLREAFGAPENATAADLIEARRQEKVLAKQTRIRLTNQRNEATVYIKKHLPNHCYSCESPCKYAGKDPSNGAQRCAECLLMIEKARAETAEAERNFLVTEYERAISSEGKGFTHAAAHLYNAIVNARCDAGAERFLELLDRAEAAEAQEASEDQAADALIVELEKEAPQ